MRLSPIFLSMISFLSLAQKKVAPGVQLAARPFPDSILLRWAPSEPQSWTLGNKYGYIVERYTLVENKLVKNPPLKVMLSPQPIVPYPLPQWESVAKASSYGAIAAQAIYGETFETPEAQKAQGNKPMIRQAYEKSAELEMRFSFALVSADLNSDVAKVSGLKWTDKEVKKGNKYLYRVYLALPEGLNIAADTGFVYTGTDEYSPLPKPVEFSAVFSDTTVVLSWNQKLLQPYYVAYDIEQSMDGGLTFQKRNKEPFIGINERPENPYVFFVDTTRSRKELLYRIRGLSSFGEKGPASVVQKGVCKPNVRLAPEFVQGLVLNNKEVALSWQYDKQNLSNMVGYKVYRSENIDRGYRLLNATVLPASSMAFKDNKPLLEGYYKIAAVDRTGKELESLPILVQLEDHEPPLPPTKVSGMIAKDGLLSLRWAQNAENDLLGYYVYRSNDRRQEYSKITGQHIPVPSFNETLNLRSLTDSVYYQITAIDGHYNESKPFVLALKKPDILPPAPVAILKNESVEKGIYLVWANSSSKDAVGYKVFRSKNASKEAVELAKIPHKGDTTAFTDTSALWGESYQYTIITVDASGLSSIPVSSLKLSPKKPVKRTEFLSARAVRDTVANHIVLEWKTTGTEVKHWIIYRASQGERLSQYESTRGNGYTDLKIQKSKTYYYHIRPAYNHGELGPLSPKITVAIK